MEALSEWLLKEIERMNNIKELYWEINIESFNLNTGMQTKSWWEWTRYYATTDNNLTIESKIEIENPISQIAWRLLFITLIYSIKVKTHKKLAETSSIDETLSKSSDYMIWLIGYLLKNHNEFTLFDWDNLRTLKEIETQLYNKYK